MTTTKLSDLVSKVRCTSIYGNTKLQYDKMDDWQKRAHPYRVTLRYKGRQMSVDFFMGQAHTDEPDSEGVLDCLLSDSQAGEQDFEGFCADMGYDTDSRKAEATWKACQEINRKLRRFLGDDFEPFLYADRN